MKKTAAPRQKPTTEFEQIPVALVKKIADRTTSPTAGQRKRPVGEKFIDAPAVQEVKRGR